MPFAWWVVVACGPDLHPVVPYLEEADPAVQTSGGSTSTDAEQPPADPVDPCGEDPLCVDASKVPVVWTLEPGWTSYYPAVPVGDLNGDGQTDAVWLAGSPTGAVDSLAVFGPLDRTVVLPRDADLHVLDAGIGGFGDANGDGVVDAGGLRLIDNVHHSFVLLGPLAGTIDPTTAGIGDWLQPTYVEDFDRDGNLELIDHTNAGFRAWLGTVDGWGVGAPTLEFVQSCPLTGLPALAIHPIVDWDGDTVRDLWVWDQCGGWIVPGTARGVLTVGDGGQIRAELRPEPVGDQNGDTVEDYAGVYLGPLTFAADGMPQSDRLIGFDSDLSFSPLPDIDLDADGAVDFLVVHLFGGVNAGYSVRFYTGGPAGGYLNGGYVARFATPDDSVEVVSSAPFVEGGALRYFVATAGGMGVMRVTEAVNVHR